MLREKRRRESLGQSCIFVSRGWLVDTTSLERFSRRARISSRITNTRHENQAEVELPPDVRCIPLPSSPNAITAPTDLETLRKLFHYTSVLFHSFFDRDFTSMVRRDYSMLDAAHNIMLDALRALSVQQYTRAGPLLDSAFSLFDDIVTSNHPNGLSVVLKTVAACYRHGFADIGTRVADYAREMAGGRLDERDPRWVLYQMLPTLKMSEARGNKGMVVPRDEVVGVYEVFCRDLWRRKRPGGGVLVLLWYPSLFCW